MGGTINLLVPRTAKGEVEAKSLSPGIDGRKTLFPPSGRKPRYNVSGEKQITAPSSGTGKLLLNMLHEKKKTTTTRRAGNPLLPKNCQRENPEFKCQLMEVMLAVRAEKTPTHLYVFMCLCVYVFMLNVFMQVSG